MSEWHSLPVLHFFDMACYFPFYVDDKPVPCGKCPACLIRRTDGWIFRIMQEAKSACSMLFVTLTYDDFGLDVSPNGFFTLNKRHFQLFMKRFRRAHPKDWPKIKYYACGEYGSQNERPHFHALILNGDPKYLQQSWRDDEGVMRGDVFLGDSFTEGAIAYTVGYMCKPKIIPKHRRDDRVPEFALMSKGMGLSYLTPQMVQYHKDDLSRTYVTMPGGKRSALPRYFADRIFSKSDKEIQQVLLDKSVRETSQRIYNEFIKAYGSADDFIRAQNDNRREAVRVFQNRFKQRNV